MPFQPEGEWDHVFVRKIHTWVINAPCASEAKHIRKQSSPGNGNTQDEIKSQHSGESTDSNDETRYSKRCLISWILTHVVFFYVSNGLYIFVNVVISRCTWVWALQMTSLLPVRGWRREMVLMDICTSWRAKLDLGHPVNLPLPSEGLADIRLSFNWLLLNATVSSKKCTAIRLEHTVMGIQLVVFPHIQLDKP